jgi:D-tyrosyl-tRNA(Tyr) deacylase
MGPLVGQDGLVRAVVQVAVSASVTVRRDDGSREVTGAFDGPGLVVLVGATHDDTPEHAERLADKVWQLRVMDDERSASDLGAPLLVVSQFTLYADLRKGRRPSWSAAAPRPVSEPLVDAFCEALRARGARVETGEFGADMQVALVNDGPRTIVVEV